MGFAYQYATKFLYRISERFVNNEDTVPKSVSELSSKKGPTDKLVKQKKANYLIKMVGFSLSTRSGT